MNRFAFLVSLIVFVGLFSPAAYPETTVMFQDDFEGTWGANWSTTGTWVQSTDQSYNGSYAAGAANYREGNLTSNGIDAVGAQSITVDFWFYKDDTDAGSDCLLYYYDGSSYNQVADLDSLGGDDTWLRYTDVIEDSRYFVSNFAVRFNANMEWGENIWVDDVYIAIETACATHTYYQDSDEDTYGNPAVFQDACTAPDGYVTDSTDCNDADPSINPGAEEIVGDGVDQNCDGFDDIFTYPTGNPCMSDPVRWKRNYDPEKLNWDCMACHTTCTSGGLNQAHRFGKTGDEACQIGGPWGSQMQCNDCHTETLREEAHAWTPGNGEQ